MLRSPRRALRRHTLWPLSNQPNLRGRHSGDGLVFLFTFLLYQNFEKISNFQASQILTAGAGEEVSQCSSYVAAAAEI
jgi:hypothetical protein